IWSVLDLLDDPATAALPCAPDHATARVGEDVGALGAGEGRAAIPIAAGYGAAEAVGVLEDGEVIVALRTTAREIEGVHTFIAAPAPVPSRSAAGRRIVDLLPPVLTHIADPQVAGQPVEAES